MFSTTTTMPPRLALAVLLPLTIALPTGCSIENEQRCGAGEVYRKPACFPTTNADASTTEDAASDAVAGEAGGGTKTCLQISLCKQTCDDSACRDACADDGCQSARLAADVVETCTQTRCASECTDPKATDCVSCSQRECASEITACLGVTCP